MKKMLDFSNILLLIPGQVQDFLYQGTAVTRIHMFVSRSSKHIYVSSHRSSSDPLCENYRSYWNSETSRKPNLNDQSQGHGSTPMLPSLFKQDYRGPGNGARTETSEVTAQICISWFLYYLLSNCRRFHSPSFFCYLYRQRTCWNSRESNAMPINILPLTWRSLPRRGLLLLVSEKEAA